MKAGCGDYVVKTDAIVEMAVSVTRRQVFANALMDGWAQNVNCHVKT